MRSTSPDTALRREITRLGLSTQHVDAWVDGQGRLRRIVTSACPGRRR